VYRLFGIPHHQQLARSGASIRTAAEGIDQPLLQPVRILILVHHQKADPPPEPAPAILPLLQHASRQELKIRDLEGLPLPLRRGIPLLYPRQKGKQGIQSLPFGGKEELPPEGFRQIPAGFLHPVPEKAQILVFSPMALQQLQRPLQRGEKDFRPFLPEEMLPEAGPFRLESLQSFSSPHLQ